ncbi:CBO0543 family protein [Alteribacillus sp. HJP-4]|uniref:CBO0543 family protein n=1 Tax=Alteribacillus sp. HJP-4 TaxID=2775394 RepID=UPI0035CD21D7
MRSTVKHSKRSNIPLLPKKPSSSDQNKKRSAFLLTALTAALAGTYLDLYFVGNGLYHFPARPFPEIFPIHIVFTLAALPIITILFLITASCLQPAARMILGLLMCIGAAVGEQISEQLGWFAHHPAWKHSYSFFGYMIFLMIMWQIFKYFSRSR